MVSLLTVAVALGLLILLFVLTRNIKIRFELNVDSAFGASLKVRVGFLFDTIPLHLSGILCRNEKSHWEAIVRMRKRPLRTIGFADLIQKFVVPKKKKEAPGKKKPKKSKTPPIKIVRLRADVAIGVEDAAQSALLSGVAKLLLNQVFAVLAQEDTKFDVFSVPLYNQTKIRMVLSGILQIKSEQIIVNAVKLIAKQQKDGE